MADDTSFSSRAIREFHNALTNGSIFGVPRYTTALLPTVTNNQGGLAWDTTTNSLKGCDGSSWAAIGSSVIPVDSSLTIGTNGGSISQQSAGTPDQTGLWTGTVSNAWIIAEDADKTFNFAHAAATDPTLFIHSHNQSTTEWISFYHGGTHGQIATGSGALYFLPAGNQVYFPAGTVAAPAMAFAAGTNYGWYLRSGVVIETAIGGTATSQFSSTGFALNAGGSLQFSTANVASASTGSSFGLNTVQTPDNLFIATNTAGNALILAEYGDAGFDFAHAQATDPTLFIHSHNQSTTQWVGLTHDGTNARITTGAGSINFDDKTLGSAPAISFSGGAAIHASATPALAFGTASVGYLQVGSTSVLTTSGSQFLWSSGAIFAAGADTGLKRNSAGNIKITDGSTGGSLFLDTTNTAIKFGTAADGGLVRVAAAALRISDGGSGVGALQTARSVEVNTGTKAPTAAESFEVYTNEGDADGSIINLPTAAAGLTYTVVCQAAQTITINAATGDTIRMAASVSGTAGLISTATVGNAVTLVAINATEWIATSYVGVVGVNWTVT